MIGRQIGDYEIVERIGSGGMGTVYRAVEIHTRRSVAVKLLKKEFIDADPGMLARFEKEGETLRHLNHPNIVRMLEMLHINGDHFLVMEYVAGGSLYDLLKKVKYEAPPVLPLARILATALELSDALARAHHLKIIHRDVKPANVLLAEDGTARLADFGIALISNRDKLKDPEVALEGLYGTLGYLSPEALSGFPLDARTDLWSFGVLLFEMLTSSSPFESREPTEVMVNIFSKPLPDLEALRPDAPIALIDLVYRLLEKDRDVRLPSARLLGAEIEAIIEGRMTSRFSPRAFPAVADDGESTFAPPPLLEALFKHNLPKQVTPFVGRETEISEVLAHLADPNVPVLTILAPGGMGKTRFALEIAEIIIKRSGLIPNVNDEDTLHTASTRGAPFPHGIYFVSLVAFSDPHDILTVIADAIGFKFAQGRDPKRQLLDYMHDKLMLLILDNFEHLLAGAEIVSEIMDAAPSIKLIITSRERLNVIGEAVYPLGSLAIPDWGTKGLSLTTSGMNKLEYSAIKLFIQSARRVRPHFELHDGDLATVIQICKLVAGMPLGIVLAAAWVESLPLNEIANEIAKNVDFLETELRDIPERQRRLRAVFESSWNGLSDAEREVFKRLSVFRGGFMREAAQAVTGASLKTLTMLMNKSLLWRYPNGRYEVHELLRQYAEQQLEASGATQAATARNHHTTHYAAYMKQREVDLKGRWQLNALNEIERDFENIRAAWDWGIRQANPDPISLMAEGLSLFCEMRSRFLEGMSLFRDAHERFNADSDFDLPPVWGQVFTRWVHMWRLQQPSPDQYHPVRLRVERSLAQAHELGEIAFALWTLGALAYSVQNYADAIPALEESLSLYRNIHASFDIAKVLELLAACHGAQGRLIEFDKLAEDSLQLRKQIEDYYGYTLSLNSVALRELSHGEYATAQDHFRQIHTIQLRIGNRAWIARNQALMAWTAFCLGEIEQAQVLLRESLDNATDSVLSGKQQAVGTLAMIAVMADDFLGAKRLCQSVETLTHDDRYILRLCLSLANFGLEEYQSAKIHLPIMLRTGFNQRDTQIMTSWLAIAALVTAHNGEPILATELLALSLTHPKSPNGWLRKCPLLSRLYNDLEYQLGAGAFKNVWERGKTRELVVTVRDLLE